MTRNSDLDLEDLIECDHQPDTPIIENNVIVRWICHCGETVWPAKKETVNEGRNDK